MCLSYHIFRFTRHDIIRAATFPSNYHEKVNVLTKSEIEDIFKDNDVAKGLFPQSLIYNKTVPYKLMSENIRFIMNEHASIFSTHHQTTNISRNRENTLKISDIDMLSCSDFHKGSKKNSVAYFCDMYPSNTASNESLVHHITLHVHRAARLGKQGLLVITIR